MLHLPIPGRRRIRPVPPNAAGRRLLNLGCGGRRHPDWTNADLVPAGPDVLAVDLRGRLPFDGGQFDAVYASHVLEHLTPLEARRFLGEVRRVLCSGGVARIVVPDLEGIVRGYLAALDAVDTTDTEPARWRHRWMTLELLDQLVRSRSGGAMARWWSCDPVPQEHFIRERVGAEAMQAMHSIRASRRETGAPPVRPADILLTPEVTDREAVRFAGRGERHKWMYDRLSLADLLRETGFADPRPVSATSSRIPAFASFALDADATGAAHKPDSLFMEALAAAEPT